MVWNIRTSRPGVQPELEIFVLPPNEQGFLSITIDASTVAPDSNGDRILVAGTILSKNVNNQYERYTGAVGQEVRGILAHKVALPDGTAKSDKDAALAFHGEVFRADRIVDFGTLGTAVREALFTCRFH